MEKGILCVVATPIGNMGDITERALKSLEAADIIASEDTRNTGMLLKRLGIRKPQLSFHSFNEDAACERIAAELERGKVVALVSDAGTPGISDPGFSVVRMAAERGYAVTMAPGPTALIMALVLSALPTSSFTFRGFPPRSSSRRRKFFNEDSASPHTLIYYESPHRLAECLEDLLYAMGDRRMALCNDLTKKFEEVARGSISAILASLAGKEGLLGEYIIVVEGCHRPEAKRSKGNKYRQEGVSDGG